MNINQTQLTDDSSSWPSRYYGHTRHLDLGKIYTDVLLKSAHQQDRKEKANKRRVRISAEAPTVYEYEPEYDADDMNKPSPTYMPIDPSLVARMILQDKEEDTMTAVVYRPSSLTITQARSLKRLDLRPVPNPSYQPKTAPPSVTSDDNSGSVSSAEPVTPDAPFPERSWSTSKTYTPLPVSRKIDVVRKSLSRIRTRSWISKKAIQEVL